VVGCRAQGLGQLDHSLWRGRLVLLLIGRAVIDLVHFENPFLFPEKKKVVLV
jgi:hypothetical protein